MEQTYKKIKEQYPDRYSRLQLKESVFQGMHPHLRDMMRFLYLQEHIGYKEFLLAIQEVEAEGSESKVLGVESKAMNVEVTENKELEDIKNRIDTLASIMKACTSPRKSNVQARAASPKQQKGKEKGVAGKPGT